VLNGTDSPDDEPLAEPELPAAPLGAGVGGH